MINMFAYPCLSFRWSKRLSSEPWQLLALTWTMNH